MVLGVVLISIAIFQYAEHQIQLKKALAQAEVLVGEKSTDLPQTKPLTTPASDPDPSVTRQQFHPADNDVIGLLEIPKIKAELPIIEGTDEEMLEKGVGHYSGTVFPSDGEQILLSGHRDTVFRKFGELGIGDRFIVKMPYGSFEYEIASTKIVDKNDTSVIRPMGEEVLVVSTCYPFRYVGAAPDRYVVYAYPVSNDKGTLSKTNGSA
ncbi:class D sortase [Paenibacillus sp. VCA1]|uniref:class D sortase n=1 Tax=Paenibacillus sp. VCA1 TaxID=3039148 RepID=UPI002870B722|nr:class D sortase [Paenibacillus sp. VCA1]MDR9852066.1 class D sortase [Paenibacillus sp. VCA1]